MSPLYITLVAVAFVGVFPLRRYADRKWADHVQRQLTAKIRADFERFNLAIGMALVPALSKMAAAAVDAARSMEKFAEVFETKGERP